MSKEEYTEKQYKCEECGEYFMELPRNIEELTFEGKLYCEPCSNKVFGN